MKRKQILVLLLFLVLLLALTGCKKKKEETSQISQKDKVLAALEEMSIPSETDESQRTTQTETQSQQNETQQETQIQQEETQQETSTELQSEIMYEEGYFDGYDAYGNGYILKDGIKYFDRPCPYPLREVKEEEDGSVTWYQNGTTSEAMTILATETLRARYMTVAAEKGFESYSMTVTGGCDEGPCVGVYSDGTIFHGTLRGRATLPDGTVVY